MEKMCLSSRHMKVGGVAFGLASGRVVNADTGRAQCWGLAAVRPHEMQATACSVWYLTNHVYTSLLCAVCDAGRQAEE